MVRKTAKVHPYRCQADPLAGHRYAEIMPQARKAFRTLQKQTKRRPYVRSSYFRKDKIFFSFFWSHLQRKPLPDRARRLKYLPCAVELLRKSQNDPLTFADVHDTRFVRYQFVGRSPDGTVFRVIVKQDVQSGQKQLLSIFPEK